VDEVDIAQPEMLAQLLGGHGKRTGCRCRTGSRLREGVEAAVCSVRLPSTFWMIWWM